MSIFLTGAFEYYGKLSTVCGGGMWVSRCVLNCNQNSSTPPSSSLSINIELYSVQNVCVGGEFVVRVTCCLLDFLKKSSSSKTGQTNQVVNISVTG